MRHLIALAAQVLRGACLGLLALGSMTASTAWAADRVALVIGNAAYTHAPRLNNPTNDAQDLAKALREIGFTTTLLLDARKSQLEQALASFADTAVHSQYALVFFAGHGVEVSGINYLLPVEATLANEASVPLEAVALPNIMSIVRGAHELGIVVVDACRDNPLVNSMYRVNPSRSASRGLKRVEPTGNLLVAYSAKENTLAQDGSGRNSPFVESMLSALRGPPTEIRLFWGDVRDEVLRKTGGTQEPFVYGTLGGGRYYLKAGREPTHEEGSNLVVRPRHPDVPSGYSAELVDYRDALTKHTSEAYRAFLTAHSQGENANTIRAKLASCRTVSQSHSAPHSESVSANETRRDSGESSACQSAHHAAQSMMRSGCSDVSGSEGQLRSEHYSDTGRWIHMYTQSDEYRCETDATASCVWTEQVENTLEQCP